jgi:thermitase
MKHKMRTPLQALLILFSIATVSGSLITETAAEKKVPELNLADLASTAPSGRTLELGQAVPSENSLKKEVQVLMKDPAMSEKWGLKLTDSKRAWRVSQGSKDIVVAVIDTGADMHTDLINNLWRNSGETGKDVRGNDKSTNGIDDDQNGYVDDVHGFNFVGGNHDLSDNHGHGTHIAGIIGAEAETVLASVESLPKSA